MKTHMPHSALCRVLTWILAALLAFPALAEVEPLDLDIMTHGNPLPAQEPEAEVQPGKDRLPLDYHQGGRSLPAAYGHEHGQL